MQGARPLTVKEVFIVLRYCKDVREECLIVIGMNLGLRVSELVTLKWRDVMHRGHVLPLLYLQRNLTKGKRPRGVPINSKAAKAIMRLHRSQKNGCSLKKMGSGLGGLLPKCHRTSNSHSQQ
jgi:integrase